MEMLDLDTVVVVYSTGEDEDYNIKSVPGMVAYIMPGTEDCPATLHIEIPINYEGQT